MKTRIIRSLSFIFAVAMMMSCTDQPYFDIPYDENGEVIFSELSVVESDGVTTADESFTVNCLFPSAKAGDVMEAEVLMRQVPSWDQDGALQLLPVAGTKKSITVAADFTATVTYTKAEANLINVGDAVTVVFSGPTDSGIIEIRLETAP